MTYKIKKVTYDIPKLKSSELKGAIFGTLLGDSKIERNGKVFSSKQISLDLIQFKYSILNNHFQEVKLQTTPPHHDGKWNHQRLFEVRVKEIYFHKLFPRFYDDKRKYLSIKHLEGLTDLGLALWFADDGCTSLIGKNKGKITNRRVMFCSECYTEEEHDIMIRFFKIKYGYTMSKPVRGSKKTKKFRLQFSVKDAQNFILKVGPYFMKYFPSLSYKLDMGYDTYRNNHMNTVSEEYKEFFNECVKTHPDFIDRLDEINCSR